MENNLFETVKADLNPRLEIVLRDLLPGGRVLGREYVCASTGGGSGDSCKTSLKTGVGSDFATGEKWGDIIALTALVMNCGQEEAARFLADEYHIDVDTPRKPMRRPRPRAVAKGAKPDKTAFVPVMPIPDSAPDFPEQYRTGPHWCYHDADGMELCYTFRLDKPDGSKDFVPLCFGQDAAGNHQWVAMTPTAPRPLYGLDRLAKAAPDAPILLVEGEKTADGAQTLFPDHVCMTWMGGGNATGKADFSPLAGRSVTIWPDNDAPGMKAAAGLVDLLHKVNTREVTVVFPPDCLPKKWDVADPAPDGFDPRLECDKAMEREEFLRAVRLRYGETGLGATVLELLAGAEDDFDLAPWPKLSGQALPGFVGEFVDLATRDSEADPAAVLATLHVRFGAEVYGFAKDKGPFIQVGEDAHPPRLFAVICGNSAKARKGTSRKPVKRLFGRDLLESAELAALNLPPPARESGGPLSSGEGLAYPLRDNAQDDGSGLARDAGDKRLCIVDEELASGLTCTKREGNTLSMAVRTFWDGGEYAPLTKNSPMLVTGAHICILTHITTAELAALFSAVNMLNGFGNRFLWICAKRQKYVANPEPMPLAEITTMQRQLWRLVAQAQRLGEVPLTADAREYWTAIYPELARDNTGKIGPIVNRAEAQAKRLALVYALLDGQTAIATRHIESALAFWKYAHDSAAVIFGGRAVDPVEKKILAVLEAGPCSATELGAALSRHLTRDKMQSVIGHLEAANRIAVSRQSSGGRPKTILTLL
ncbi:MAG: DUF6371 domain-containing protein [Planctomycetota bacterium]|jgi:hypothetical protein|nr:DUF6371 domain-containing protein [Planctomycetota bacterium]